MSTQNPEPPAGLAAVLFDLDGTLVDTEPYWIEAEYALVESFGGHWTQAHAHALVGNPLLVSGEYIREHGGVPLTAAEIVRRLLIDVTARTEQHPPWRPGALALLTGLRAEGVPCAMVTMSYASLARSVERRLPPGTFATVVAGDEVRHGKPHPEPYLTAAARLGVDPERCVAIEDSPTGIASAEAAGCVTLAVPCQLPIEEAATRTVWPTLVDVTVADLRQLVARQRITD
jgi:HAD superfamily hydrolase (TIGR01509 family)